MDCNLCICFGSHRKKKKFLPKQKHYEFFKILIISLFERMLIDQRFQKTQLQKMITNSHYTIFNGMLMNKYFF